MKKILLPVFGLTISAFAFAQNNSKTIISHIENDQAIKINPTADGSELISGPVATSSIVRSLSSTVIGTTIYDLQTNGTNQRRIVNHSDGTISATWTMDNGADPYNNRGAGYNYYDGTTWGAQPTSKVETTRNGWPALTSGAANDNEFIVSHSGSGGLTLNKRDAKGTGAWTESIIPTTIPAGFDVLWPRAVIGGEKDSTLHVIAAVRNSTTGGPAFKGLVTALVYYRSKNLGTTWDIQDSILPGLDSSVFTYVSADAYSIDARGNTIAFAVFNSWGDVLTYKSTNNGDTWSQTIVSDFPINKYKVDDGSDINNDGINDTIMSCDGSGSIILDNNNNVHVFYGRVRVLDNDLTDEQTSFFPGTNGLLYWNESFGTDSTQVIAGVIDDNGNNVLDVAPTGGSLPRYGVGLSSMPSCGISANGTLYLVYSAITETHSDGTQNYRHLYVIKSSDGGDSWSDPIDYTPDFSFAIYEAVFPSMAKHVDENIHIIYQRDFNPGISIAGDKDPASVNDIVYLSVDTTMPKLYSSIVENNSDYTVNLYPNPANDVLNVKISSDINSNEKLNVTLVDAIGRTVATYNENLTGKTSKFSINVLNLEKGVYFVRIATQEGVTTKTFIKK